MAYLYIHTRLDKNEVFYVGIGKDSDGKYVRAFSKKRRSDFWNNIVKNCEYKINILHDNLSWKEICEKEKYYINLYGRKDLKTGTLCNLTNGGDGVNGYTHNKQRLLKLSNNAKNSNNPRAKSCIHFDTGLEFKSLKEGCEHFNLKYLTEISAIRRKNSTCNFYFKNEYFERPTKEAISKKLGLLRIGNTNWMGKRKIKK
jgi:hypothetical protein